MSFPRAQWRIIRDPPASGSWNMAVDEAIMQAVAEGRSQPTIRLYAWDPPCLSIGYAQPVRDVDTQRLKRHNWDLVRRSTGGRAILHTDELTYAVIAPSTEPRLAGGVLESYRRLAMALNAALHHLEIQTEPLIAPASTPSLQQQGAVCFEIPSNYEITWQGKKLIGSAQVRRKQAILQHGTFPLFGDLSRILQVLHFDREPDRLAAVDRLMRKATTAEAVLHTKISWQHAADAFQVAFGQTLNLDLQPHSLSKLEYARACALQASKFSHPSWINRV